VKSDVKMGFFVGLGLLAALVVWHLLGRAGLGALSAGEAIA
jgi:hypothetical protein